MSQQPSVPLVRSRPPSRAVGDLLAGAFLIWAAFMGGGLLGGLVAIAVLSRYEQDQARLEAAINRLADHVDLIDADR